MDSERAIQLALREARKASGHVFPNPPVGAILFQGEQVLGRGHTQPVGGPHAEIVALEDARRSLAATKFQGATMAVTLEPCAHVGRTGPCCDALIAAGVSRVIVGHLDPHPQVRGEGVRRLEAAGVAVEVGPGEQACRQQHRGFLSVLERGRPFVELKLATSLDGRIASVTGASRWITGEASRAQVHRMRARTDAIVVGGGTARADDPELVARIGKRVVHRPVRVILTSTLDIPLDLRLLRPKTGGPSWILCPGQVREEAARQFEQRGVRVLRVGLDRKGEIDLSEGLRRLASEGLTEILLEGGGILAAGFLREGLVDAVSWFVAPILIGGDGQAGLGSLGVQQMVDALRLENVKVRRLGSDLYLRGRIASGRETK